MEWLTSRLEEEIESMTQKIEDMGGWMAALDKGWVHAELRKGLLDIQKKIEEGKRIVVGVNRFCISPEEDFKPRLYHPDVESEIKPYLSEYREFKRKRDKMKLRDALEKLRHAAERTEENLVPYVFDALKADATFPEIIGVLRMVDGLEYDWAGEREYPF